ncbi:FxsA family protein [Actinopolyspora mortivallis]|uniref:Exlusion protein FxsA n=1 Tax=Actinopolyspora mortivallis TaxID=33906 RepID=A0A2T0H1S6_ACTMO|nr:FxsA family protein [Actinopolyspora mortivallis]PRW65324.1 exlusion protein FxsA [Actinopolyspora mortivallis]
MPLFVLLLVGVAVEVGVLVLVGQAIGALPTLGLLLAGALFGSWLLRREGRRTLREFSEAARLRRPPEREISDGMFVGVAALLILLPGLVSDLLGLLLLFPPTRALLRGPLRRGAQRRQQRMEQHMRERMSAFGAAGFDPGVFVHAESAQTRDRRGREDVIDGEVVSVTEDDEHHSDSSGPELPGQTEEPPYSEGNGERGRR